jgi:hypothetical protein
MPVQARYRKQRRVTRGAWRPRFTKQKVNYRGSTKIAAPTLASISPTTGVKGAANATITCTGTGFVSEITKVTFDGVDQVTTFSSATVVTAVMPLLTITTAGTKSVNVRTGTLFSATPKTYTVT